MTLSFGDYEQSYPPEVLRGYAAPVLAGAARGAGETGDTDLEGEQTMSDPIEPTTPPPDLGPESNAPEGAVPVDATRTEPDGVAVVAVPAEVLDEAAANPPEPDDGEAEATATVRGVRDDTSLDDLLDPGVDEASSQVDASSATEASTGGVSGSLFTVTAGTPGSYEPEVGAADRPRNVTELRSSAQPVDGAPWPAGSYVLVGTTGKRAHWSGEDWHTGESPGYDPAVVDEPVDDDPDADR